MDGNNQSFSSSCHSEVLSVSSFLHIFSLQEGDSPAALDLALSCEIHEDSGTTPAQVCWIIWCSHATPQCFSAALNKMCYCAECNGSFLVCCGINKTLLLMKICDFTNEIRHILSNPEEAKYPGDQRPHVWMCCWAACVERGSEPFIQTVSQPVTKKNSCLFLIPCSHLLPLTHTASKDGEDSFITQQNKLKQYEVARPPGSSLNQPSAPLTLFVISSTIQYNIYMHM